MKVLIKGNRSRLSAYGCRFFNEACSAWSIFEIDFNS